MNAKSKFDMSMIVGHDVIGWYPATDMRDREYLVFRKTQDLEDVEVFDESDLYSYQLDNQMCIDYVVERMGPQSYWIRHADSDYFVNEEFRSYSDAVEKWIIVADMAHENPTGNWLHRDWLNWKFPLPRPENKPTRSRIS